MTTNVVSKVDAYLEHLNNIQKIREDLESLLEHLTDHSVTVKDDLKKLATVGVFYFLYFT